MSDVDDRLGLTAALCAGLPHDLRNLLAVAETSVFVAKKKLDDREALSAQLERTSAALRSAQQLLSTILAFARGDRLITEPCLVGKLVEDTLRMVAGEGRARVGVEVDPADLTVAVAPCLFHAALLNLIQNALEAVNGGGNVRVRASRSDGRVRIAVEDEGPGFAPPDSPQRSALGSTKEGGTGLGLRAARAVAIAHGGELRIEEPELGARVVLEFSA